MRALMIVLARTAAAVARPAAAVALAAAAVAPAAVVLAPAAAAQCRLLCLGGPPAPSEPSPAPVPVPSEPPPPVALGFSDVTALHPSFPNAVFTDLIAGTGGGLHRWVASWGNYEPSAGAIEPGYLAHLEETYAAQLERGIRPVVVLFGSPRWTLDPWARTPGGGRPCKDPAVPCLAPPNVRNGGVRAAWKEWVRTIVRRFPQAAGIEVWNEPNLQWSWVVEQDPALYALLVKATREAVGDLGSAIPVLTGGLSDTTRSSSRSTSLEDMLRAVYYHAGHGAFDAISFHVYPCAQHSSATTHPQSSLERVRRYKAAKGDLARPVWITETGAATAGSASEGCGLGYTDGGQAAALSDVVAWARSTQSTAGDLPVVLVNSLVNAQPRADVEVPHTEGRLEYGVVAWAQDAGAGASIRPKPAYDALRCAFAGTC